MYVCLCRTAVPLFNVCVGVGVGVGVWVGVGVGTRARVCACERVPVCKQVCLLCLYVILPCICAATPPFMRQQH